MTNANTSAQYYLGASLEQLVLRVPKKFFEDKIASLLDTHLFPTLKFEPEVDLGEAKGRHLRNLVWFLTQALDDAGFKIPQLAMEELEQAVATTFLYCVRSSVSDLLERKPPAAAPWQVRRAEEYIEANWSSPLTTEALSGAINSSVRSLFKTFAESRGYTPMEFLRNVRLRHARAMLVNPSDTTTVTAVGLACGFLNLGHFAKHYQSAFGELPSDTLTRTKGTVARQDYG